MNPVFSALTREMIAETDAAWRLQCSDEDWDRFFVWIKHFDSLVDVSSTQAKSFPHARIHAIVDPANPQVALALVNCHYKGGKSREVRLMDVVLSPELEEAKDAASAQLAAITIASAFVHTLSMAMYDYSAQRFKIHANAHWQGEFLNQLSAAASAMASGMFHAVWEGSFLVLVRGPDLAVVQTSPESASS